MRKADVCVPQGMKAVVNGNCVSIIPHEEEHITERVKSFDDACEELGHDNLLVHDYFVFANEATCYHVPMVEAYLKLRIVCAALNEGWLPSFNKDEIVFVPRFALCNKVKAECFNFMPMEELNLGDYVGLLACSAEAIKLDNTYIDTNIDLYLKDKGLAQYCAMQFSDLWAKYYLNK